MRESDAVIAKRIAFLEIGLRWTEIEVRAHAFLDGPGEGRQGGGEENVSTNGSP